VELDIQDLLKDMVGQGASDMHVKVGVPPGFRIDGKIHQQSQYPVLTAAQSSALVKQMLDEEQWERFERDKDMDFSVAIPNVARFRVNALTQRGAHGLVIRVIPEQIPTASQLGLPQICLDLAMKPRGLVLVTGPTGSGKSTTLAAMVDYINEHESGHILTMEDPLEFMHTDKQCYVTQRNIGHDCESFSQALRRALRQDPDVILIGEMRDLETISMAITAAETGHLVFGTLHTTSAISTVDRIIDVFPTDAQQQVRVQLATTIQGVISQCLVPKIGGGRVAAHEILVATDGIRSLIREGKTPQILNLLQTGKGHGMSTLEGVLCDLVGKGLITREDAIGKANRPDEVAKNAKAGPRSGATSEMNSPGAGSGGGSAGGRSPAGAGSGGMGSGGDGASGAGDRTPARSPRPSPSGGGLGSGGGGGGGKTGGRGLFSRRGGS